MFKNINLIESYSAWVNTFIITNKSAFLSFVISENKNKNTPEPIDILPNETYICSNCSELQFQEDSVNALGSTHSFDPFGSFDPVVIVFKDDVVSDPVLVFENDVVFGVDFGSFDPVVIVIAVDFIPGGAVGPVIKVFDMIVSIIQTFLIISKSKLASQEYELFFIEHFMEKYAGTMIYL